MNGKRARSKLNDLACRTLVDRVLDIGEVVLPPAKRIDRGADCRPVRDAADSLQAGVLPVRIGVVIGRQHAAGGIGAVAGAGAPGGAGGRELVGARSRAAAIAAGATPAHGPLPLTVDAVPAVQRFAVGAVLTVAPFEVPHAPFMGCAATAFVAEQVAVVPPPLPAQVHDHGPLPLTVDAVPALQRFAVGALVRLAPFEEPHAPLTLEVPLRRPSAWRRTTRWWGYNSPARC